MRPPKILQINGIPYNSRAIRPTVNAASATQSKSGKWPMWLLASSMRWLTLAAIKWSS